MSGRIRGSGAEDGVSVSLEISAAEKRSLHAERVRAQLLTAPVPVHAGQWTREWVIQALAGKNGLEGVRAAKLKSSQEETHDGGAA